MKQISLSVWVKNHAFRFFSGGDWGLPRGLVFGLILLLGQIPAFAGAAQLPPDPLLNGMEPLVRLNGYWYTQDHELFVQPFVTNRSELEVRTALTVRPGPNLPDTIYLYLRGLAWSADVYLNQQLLVVTHEPFRSHLIPVAKSWLRPSDNVVRVHLHKDGARPEGYPEAFTGIFRDGWVVRRSKKVDFSDQIGVNRQARRVVAFASWYPNSGYRTDTVAFGEDLKLLKEAGVEQLFFPFPPPAEYEAMAARAGFEKVLSLEGCDSVAWFNAYPTVELPEPFMPFFWRDSAGKPTSHAGSFQYREQRKAGFSEEPDRVWVLVCLFLPLLGLVLLKFVGQKTWSFMIQFLFRFRFFFDLIKNNKFLKPSSAVLINGFGQLVLGVSLGTWLYFLRISNRLDTLNILSGESWATRFLLYWEPGVLELVGLSLGFVFLLSFLKVATATAGGLVYRTQGLANTVLSLEVVATQPVVLLLLVPSGAMFFVDPQWGWITSVIWQLFFVIYLVRKTITLYAGLSYVFQFSAGLKILYICALELLPWILVV